MDAVDLAHAAYPEQPFDFVGIEQERAWRPGFLFLCRAGIGCCFSSMTVANINWFLEFLVERPGRSAQIWRREYPIMCQLQQARGASRPRMLASLEVLLQDRRKLGREKYRDWRDEKSLRRKCNNGLRMVQTYQSHSTAIFSNSRRTPSGLSQP